MADSASESDSGSVDGLCSLSMTREQYQKRIDSLQQENKVLKLELETYKFRIKSLQEENKYLRQVSVNIVSIQCLISLVKNLEVFSKHV